MPAKPCFGQLYPNGEYLQSYDHASGFLRYVVGETPINGVYNVEDCGTEEDAEEEGERGFGEVEGIADEGGEEGVGEEEGGEDEVGEVGGDGLEVFVEPRHGGCGVLGGVLGKTSSGDRGWDGDKEDGVYEIIVRVCCISQLLLMSDVSQIM